jgi:pimeloyl-ACP methyl ester carboxylesterase
MTKEDYNQHAVVNGTTLCYDDCGDSEIPILFIHGFPFDKSCWDPQMSFLKRNHRVIQYDIRGFGKSEAGTDEASMTLYADDLILFMDLLGIQKAIVCGISMGGYILMNAVHRFPERFKALVLCDTQCIADSPEARLKRDENIRLIEEGKLLEFANIFIARYLALNQNLTW